MLGRLYSFTFLALDGVVGLHALPIAIVLAYSRVRDNDSKS